jgi:hypothetical protein
MKSENWNFTVVGCSHNVPKYLGFTETREKAETLQKNMEAVGWSRVAIFDAAHQEQVSALQKEVAEKDKKIEYLEDLLKRQQGQGYGRG